MIRALPALLALTALVGDLAGHHGAGLVLLLAAVPAAFAVALECYGDALEARCGGLRPLGAVAALLLLVISAALRSPAVVGGVPQLALTGVVLALAVYAALAVGALLQADRVVPESA
jgi:hypothetical protein